MPKRSSSWRVENLWGQKRKKGPDQEENNENSNSTTLDAIGPIKEHKGRDEGCTHDMHNISNNMPPQKGNDGVEEGTTRWGQIASIFGFPEAWRPRRSPSPTKDSRGHQEQPVSPPEPVQTDDMMSLFDHPVEVHQPKISNASESEESSSESESESDSDSEDDPFIPQLQPRDPESDDDSEIFSDSDDEDSDEILDPFLASFVRSEPTVAPANSLDTHSQSQHGDNHGIQHEETPVEGMHKKAPSLEDAKTALGDLSATLKPRRKTGPGFKDPGLNVFVRERMEGMAHLLRFYTNPRSRTHKLWAPSAYEAAIGQGRGEVHYSRKLREWTQAYIKDRTKVPCNPYGKWNKSRLEDEDLSLAIKTHLQSLGTFIKARDIVNFLDRPQIKSKYGIKKTISEQTARKWLHKMGYRWSIDPKGQYVDGHERKDVVDYRQDIFLKGWSAIESTIRTYSHVGEEEARQESTGKRTVVWYHDESTFYAHDRRRKKWIHKDQNPVPYQKGEGLSLMVAEFMSAEYGLLRSPDGKRSARRLFRAGKNRDGYFTNEEILDQVREAMEILKEYYPNDNHIFVYDNATTHLKRPENALSARNMVKKPSPTWGIDVNETGPDGRPVLVNGKPVKTKIRMADGHFDGNPQSFYYPDNHPDRPGWFKGMVIILQERGFDTTGLLAECKDFKCPPGATDCCCRRILFNQPDFVDQKSKLEITCEAEGFHVMFLPKFHCELNPIEQCWGYAKRLYRMCPPSSQDADLEKNVISSLDSVPLTSMRRFCNRSRRFMDAYRKGLNGKQAAWAARKYRGHRVLPESLMDDMEKANL